MTGAGIAMYDKLHS